MTKAPNPKTVLAKRLKGLRLARGLTQYEVARAVLGSEDRFSDISKWESGKHTPSPAMLDRLTVFFEVDL